MSNRNYKILSRGRTSILLIGASLLSLSFLLFASGLPSTEKIAVADKVWPKTEAISAPEHQRKQTRTVESEVITITQRGFEPTEITRPLGEFILIIENPNRRELNLTLTRENGASLQRVRATREEPNWNELEDLPPGRYVLTEESHPEWSCVITITAR